MPFAGFTSSCGQSIYRRNKFPYDSPGSLFFLRPHPSRGSSGLRGLSEWQTHASQSRTRGRFLRSSDFNSRFINTAVGPDGCLYVTDMYRGIIQDAPWFNEGNREFARRTGVNKHIQMGRIWRIRHKDHLPYSEKPQMLSESTEGGETLQNPIGWWRDDTAQKLILLRKDREKAIPLLMGLFRFTQSPLPRMHALWTLDGMKALTPEIKREALADRSPVVRKAMVQIIEPALPVERTPHSSGKGTRSQSGRATPFTLGTTDEPEAEEVIQTLASNHLSDQGVMLATTISLWGKKHLPFIEKVKSKNFPRKFRKTSVEKSTSLGIASSQAGTGA